MDEYVNPSLAVGIGMERDETGWCRQWDSDAERDSDEAIYDALADKAKAVALIQYEMKELAEGLAEVTPYEDTLGLVNALILHNAQLESDAIQAVRFAKQDRETYLPD